MRRLPCFAVLLTLPALILGCGDDSTTASRGDFGDVGETTFGTLDTFDGDADADADGDGDGDPTGDGDGDGDGDPTGDGDGDGDPTGDGDGDPTGDGDGDPTGDGDGDPTGDGDGDPPFCTPGVSVCSGDNVLTCLDDGTDYAPPVACAANEGCIAGGCVAQCDLIEATPSSVGCSFFATKHDNHYSNANDASKHDSLIAGNISSDQPVNAQLYFVPVGSNVEQAQGAPVVIQPQSTYTWVLSQVEIDSITTTRQGGVYRLETDMPIVAYQHSPIGSTATNDASMLLPAYALTGNYIVSSYPGTIGPYPSYMMAIGTVDGTIVDLTVGGPTAAGGGIPALATGQTTQVILDRYEVLNLVVSQQQGGDLSGTIVSANSPLHVIGATECANVPNSSQVYCDHMEEISIPLEYWGEEYVGAHAPTRGSEKYHWRVYGGEDGLTINTAPQQPGFPLQLNKGEYYQFAATGSFVITGSGPFMPVQYLESQNPYAGTGDPGMYQMVPTEQFLNSYAFVTGTNYNQHYAQITRPAGGADVTIDGNVVAGYVAVGNYEVADVAVSEGAHFATSAQPFGVVQVGYTPVTSYAYPGGLKLEVINPQ